jgi:flagellin-like hook-associated protein FlgL
LAETTNTAGTAYGDSVTVQVGSAAATTVTFGNGTGEVDSTSEIVSALNAISNVSASVGDDGTISIEATNGEDLVLAEGTGTPLSDLGITAGTTAASENTDRTAFAAQFDELRTQINQLAADASFNGNNLLAGDSLTVTFNEDSSSSLTVTGVNFNSAGLGIDSSTDTFQKDSDINAALADLSSATSTLRAQSSKFGSNLSVVETRQDFTKSLINVLETGAANLTLADTNEEGANLLALQTRQQLSSTSLSLASQADQNVLRLF